MVLCDNEVDRDFEKFSDEALGALSELFVGKTGIFDHEWKATNQTARIYRTEILKENGVLNSLGEPYAVLKGYAYMLRNEKNSELIEEIEAGIKKETSVGCSVAKRVCSICGEEAHVGGCGHIPGREYNGKLCYLELFDVKDAYEWSFVAVPAQRAAGVVKRFGASDSLKGFVSSKQGGRFFAEYEALEKDAVLGREYKNTLRNEVLRLGLLCDPKIYEALSENANFMGAKELENLKEAFEKRLEDSFPLKTQLPGRDKTVSFDGDEYMV
ncbi:MAG: hypothetical protein CVU91_08845 [Firmicutes bacterium HGW-Firmicutes-16]|nr:MAG: hypothetical protein CVU91_08845 [Firmicutes bacterium HGW-Firmicutes-16]